MYKICNITFKNPGHTEFIPFKGQVQCFSIQVVINKCFFLNLEKKLAQIRLIVFEKNSKNAHFNSEK